MHLRRYIGCRIYLEPFPVFPLVSEIDERVISPLVDIFTDVLITHISFQSFEDL
jgi:hypothetical protein